MNELRSKLEESISQWEWEKRGHNQPLACGHSGIVVGPEAETYYIEIEERNGA